jgi:UDP-2,3-diacylglucosamine hydrolase
MTPKSLPNTLLLISDLHLSPERPDLCQAFLHFLELHAESAASLYILGDFVDAWVGDDDDTPLYAELATALKRLSAKGTAINFVHGNRDFLLGERYAKSCGATLLDEPVHLIHEKQHYLLMHGDVLCTRDTAYLAFRNMVRNPLWQEDFLSRPLSERRAFAAQARAQSKSMSSNKAQDIMDVTDAAVVDLMREQNVFTLVHGHTHRPAVHKFEIDAVAARRVVLGDWRDHDVCFARISSEGLTLERFEY